ncbi:helix-turn-helix domain-containing protein [Vibrio mangrovi]|uniref:Helix-turn-helix transcriptional regulator n=1 Tax=Vibrio mangrovi TaxID=474394 RepID=A0A1Y6IS23_9VIBR|nr:helix-turn-helix transcriptional regulator [Vibrio mangrovi]MDW6003379.1 helix-turn-helix transcriptional regulator [Vibrio mangrovi]SMR99831.1 hypothetical protein VIM7927_01064 [Vibrio mangrovi]
MHQDNLKLLGNFLRAKRESIQPETIGLPKPLRSRTKGLRRDDVAYNSGISTIWYSKIERGQVTGISPQVLTAISNTLKLTKSEYEYICNLVSFQVKTTNDPCRTISDHTFHLLLQLNPFPALLMNDYLDIVSCNEAFNLMIGFSFDSLIPEEKNYLHLTITNPEWQKFLHINDEDKLKIQITRMAGFLRNALARRPDDIVLDQKIDSFIELSSTFEQAWLDNTVLQPEELSYVYEHAQLGSIMLDKQLWWNINGDSSSRLNIYHPQNDTDKERLKKVLQI